MDDGSTPQAVSIALDRIEAALRRIENVASLPVSANIELKARHEALKITVSGVLGDLDTLIENQR